MFQLDDKFLEDIGLGQMPQDQRKPFLQHIYDELELRVGTKLSEGMNDNQLQEFEAIIDRKDSVVLEWLEKYTPNYYQDAVFLQIQKASGLEANDINLLSEFAATKWLEINRPDYKSVVAQVMDDIKKEVIANRDSILGN